MDCELVGLQQQSTERLAKCASLQLFSNPTTKNVLSDHLPGWKAKFQILSQQFLVLDKKKRFLELISSSQAVDLCNDNCQQAASAATKQMQQQAEDSKENLCSLHQEIQRMQEDCNNFYGALVSGALYYCQSRTSSNLNSHCSLRCHACKFPATG
jgi:RNase P subunit RPR2